MNERDPEVRTEKDNSPDADLIDFLQKRLKLSQEMIKIRAAGRKLPLKLKKQNRVLSNTKVTILDEIVFPAMANLIYFFKMVSEHPELQEKFEDDIKDLLGVRRNNPEIGNYGHVFSNLIAFILMVEINGKPLKKDDFRLRLIQILQEIVILGFEQTLPDILKDMERFHMMLGDLSKSGQRGLGRWAIM